MSAGARRGRLLIVAHHFPPDHTIGSFRPRRMAIHLARRGWEVHVLSARPMYLGAVDEAVCEGLEAVHVHRTHAIDVRAWARSVRRPGPEPAALAATAGSSGDATSKSLARRASEALELPDRWIGWVPVAACSGAFLPRPDIVLATAPGFSNFLLGTLLAARFRAPLVLDYRDPWNAPVRRADLPAPRRHLEDALERACLRRAARVVAVTSGIAAELQEQGWSSEVVTNACEPDRFEGIEPEVFDRPTLVYAGGLYGDRTLEPVLRALAELRDEGRIAPERFQIVYLGRTAPVAEQAARAHGVEDFVRVRGSRPSAEALAATAGASCNLSIVGKGHARQVPAKIFEHLAIGRPMLVVVPDRSDTEELLAESRSARCLRAEDGDALKAALLDIAEGRLDGERAEVPERLSVRATTDAIESVLYEAMAQGGAERR